MNALRVRTCKGRCPIAFLNFAPFTRRRNAPRLTNDEQVIDSDTFFLNPTAHSLALVVEGHQLLPAIDKLGPHPSFVF